jgi:uncharacterized protein (DUF305 family)
VAATEQQPDNRILESATGTSFDRQFLTMMISHRQGAITMAKSEQSDGRYGPAKTLADNITTSQSAEISEMQGLTRTPIGQKVPQAS